MAISLSVHSGEWGKSASLRADRVGRRRRSSTVAAPVAQAAPSPDYQPPPVAWGPCPQPAARGPGRVRFRHRPAGLRAARRREDQDRGVAGEAQGRRRQGAGPDAGQPGRAGRAGPRWPCSAAPCPSTRATPTTGSASTPAASAPASPRCPAIPDYGGYNRPEYDPAKAPERGRGVAGAGRALRRGLRAKGGALLSHLTTGTPPRTWTPSARRWAPSRSTSTASPTAPTSARSTPPSSRRTSGGRCSTAWSTTAGCGTRATSTRTSRSRSHRGVLRLDRQERRRLPPRQLRRRRREALLRRAGQAPGRSGGRQDRPVRVDRHLPAGRVLRLGLGEDRVDVREVGAEARRGRAHGALRRHGLDRRRQRLRDLPRRPVHRHALAAAVRPGARRQRAGGGHRAVRDVGQRLVQRALPDVEGARAASR